MELEHEQPENLPGFCWLMALNIIALLVLHLYAQQLRGRGEHWVVLRGRANLVQDKGGLFR